MQVSARLTFAVVLAAVSPLLSTAQAPELAAHSGPVASRRITLDVVVDAKDSKPPVTVGGLQQQNFTVLDNKVPRALTSFRAVSAGQEPVRVVVLVDALNIRLDGLAYERDQVAGFFRANNGHLAHPTAIAILTEKGVQQSAFTTDGNGLAESLQKQVIAIRTLTRSTGIYGAEDRFGFSLNGLRTLVSHGVEQPGRTIILWVSPGWPLLSGPGIELTDKEEKGIFNDIVNLSTQMREDRVTLYAIDPIGSSEGVGRTLYYQDFLKGVSKLSQVDIGDLSLQVLAVQSGGMALNSNDTGQLLQRSLADLDNYYEISFEPAPAETPNVYHQLEIKIDQPRTIARTRYGYYAQP